MKKQKYTLEKEIPILDWKTKEFVRNLRPEDLSGDFAWELEHDNVKEILIDKKGEITYQTYEGGYTIVTPFDEGKLGDLGSLRIDSNALEYLRGDWKLYAAHMAINVGVKYIEKYNVYFNIVGINVWEETDQEHADRSITLFLGHKKETFHFRRIWPKEKKSRGIPEGSLLYPMDSEKNNSMELDRNH